ncbi:MAG: decaprenylphospho-beta-D-erythro-pentofuranosid-2-ulose 2-reductase, partial [Sulfitobacter sp.]
MKNILIFGASSKIAHCTARLFAAEDSKFFLVARDSTKLESIAKDLEARGANEVVTLTVDLADTSHHSACISAAIEAMARIDICLIA